MSLLIAENLKHHPPKSPVLAQKMEPSLFTERVMQPSDVWEPLLSEKLKKHHCKV